MMGDMADMYQAWEYEEQWQRDAEEAVEAARRSWLDQKCVAKQRERDRVWVQRDGTPIAVKDMTDTHLLAAARLLKRKGFIGPRTLAVYLGPGPTADAASLAFEQEQGQAFDSPVSPFVDFFEDEIKRRGLRKGGA